MMNRRGVGLVVLLVVLSFGLVVAEEECSRSRSRMARQTLRKDLAERIGQIGYRLPDGCLFHESRDMYLSDERSKHKVSARARWECTRCKKAFRSEDFLDEHFDNRHADERGVLADTCLANYCDMLQCSPMQLDADLPSEEVIRSHLALNDELCLNNGGEVRRQAFCRATLQRCFPPGKGREVQQIYNELEEGYCQTLSCDTVSRPLNLPSQMSRALWIAMFAIIGLGLLLFYVAFLTMRSDSRISDDLKARPKPIGSQLRKSAEAITNSSSLLRRKRMNTFD